MRARLKAVWAGLIITGFLCLPARATVEQDYLQVYLGLNNSEREERAGEYQEARLGFEDCYGRLQDIQKVHHDWHCVLVTSRLQDCRRKIAELQPMVHGAAAWALASPSSASPAPVDVSAKLPFLLEDSLPRLHTHVYPWKTSIVTTVFWIGEGNMNSSWDSHWIRDNGGADKPFELSGYASSLHATTLNPFYVALPFNDLAYPELAKQWLPASWAASSPSTSEAVSACKDRWVEIKNRGGRYCFAQWEDVGPIVTDDASYVFGSDRPSATRGLNVSPAVAKYLGFESAAITSWRFVDDEDVLPGMWLRYDEQAVLFRAMHEEKNAEAVASPTNPAPR